MKMNFFPQVAAKIIIVAILLFAAWRILALGLAEHYAQSAIDGVPGSAEKALAWYDKHPHALFLYALEIYQEKPQKAEELLRDAIKGTPSDGRPMVLLAMLLKQRNITASADALVNRAEELGPTNEWIRLKAAEYWVSRNQIDRAVNSWSKHLESKRWSAEVVSVLIRIADSDELRHVLKPLTDNPPDWWERFFSHYAKNAGSLNSLNELTEMRKQGAVPMLKSERKALVARMMKEQQWSSAYLNWIGGLSMEQKGQLGNIYNGGFELPISNNGFGWHFSDAEWFGLELKQERESAGEQSLHLLFSGINKPFGNRLFQPMFLMAGEYEFSSAVKSVGLETSGGLRWRVHCIDQQKQYLGESERYLGVSDWRKSRFRFTVPNDAKCRVQILQLESTGKIPKDHKLKGEVWFDQLKLVRIG
ncbi:tetratricopeptide repeat protein [Solemya elarraichensis gill symbiont]|uniref:Tetratricopeptide repeat protein n=1 Tax=Solemya elarraichensis gill symbiont TaxID=1918949 RepID=A0A1T2KX81_9GAMM|nr:hypothetical protein [Solemya elarraichensis gill symbiont]OOZ37455.1 hypothetical protein BOW52_10210 [Solemya elarraichensis gill symbiont]